MGQTQDTIKSTAAEQRQLWRDVGEALLEGRVLYPANQAFKAWCDNEGFGDIKPDTRTAALWLAHNWSVATTALPDGISHPVNIRAHHRDAQATQAPSPDLDISAPADVALERIAKVAPNARRVTALAAHAASTRPEAIKGSRLALAHSTSSPGRRRETLGHRRYHPGSCVPPEAIAGTGISLAPRR